ncbi:ATP-binding protein [Roseomonas mucosa]|uniref:ATP-binding protein n=1 Tax=Roseomonas mucosa TaxID=207340 RepID=UPI002246CCAB|nr:ATP-binding protein [Roseomonas mucosa]UZO94777.1 Chaperone protein htpG [Roseomonas mucosa]
MSEARTIGERGITPRPQRAAEPDWSPLKEDVVLGKDVLELLSMSMYVDPMTIYREYVQNAADAIDQAREAGLLAAEEKGTVTIDADAAARTIRIRDNGTGIPWDSFGKQLTALGASRKRGTRARGFRGVGRLAGLGYCQELAFRSRADGEAFVSELRWDCRRLQTALRTQDYQGNLAEIVRHAVTLRRIPAEGVPARFFEVELRNVIRHRNDRLLNPAGVAEYLAEVAPVPFHPEFSFGAEITAALASHISLGAVELLINGVDGPVYRPHRGRFEVGSQRTDEFTSLQLIEIPGENGGIAAVGWLLHHGYVGALPQSAGIKGLRLRAGNIQVGESNLLEMLFVEPRFNSWAVGEIHMVDPRIVPNGRRDTFLDNVHYANVINHLAPVARDIARHCRTSSIRRKWLREFELEEADAREKLSILDQGTLGAAARVRTTRAIRESLAEMEKIGRMDAFDDEDARKLQKTVASVKRGLERALGAKLPAAPLDALPQAKQKMYQHLFDLIYECSANQTAAKALVDRILVKIG